MVEVEGVKEWHSTHAFTFFLRVFPKGRTGKKLPRGRAKEVRKREWAA